MKKAFCGSLRLRFISALMICLLIISCGCTAKEEPHMSGKADLKDISLHLPKSYYVEANVVSSSAFGSTETSYALSENDGWVYMKLGYDREQYVYKPVSEGRYIEYRYSTEKGAYLPTMISEALQQQIDAGNVPIGSVSVGKEAVDAKRRTLEPYLCAYETLKASLSDSGEEAVKNVRCRVFTGKVNALLTKSDLKFWIDPATGLAFRYVNKTKTGLLTTRQEIEITEFSETAKIPAISMDF